MNESATDDALLPIDLSVYLDSNHVEANDEVSIYLDNNLVEANDEVCLSCITSTLHFYSSPLYMKTRYNTLKFVGMSKHIFCLNVATYTVFFTTPPPSETMIFSKFSCTRTQQRKFCSLREVIYPTTSLVTWR